MKANALFFLLFCGFTCLPFAGWAQPKLEVTGEATAVPLVRFDALNMDGQQDILEIYAPFNPTSTDGQFIECVRQGAVIDFTVMQINYDGSGFLAGQLNLNNDIYLIDDGDNSSAEIQIEDNSNSQVIEIRAKDSSTEVGGDILLRGGPTLATTIELDANWGGSGLGRIRTDELEIEGSDIAEQFDIAPAEAGVGLPAPGMLVSIHADQPGQLQVADKAYDTSVAGVISGANGVRPGMYLGQAGTLADGEFPVAVAGRVYVFADASFGAIQPGDLLTSSPTPGHAMKVKKQRKARGAVVGKAMTGLKNGTGFVLMLVNLQ